MTHKLITKGSMANVLSLHYHNIIWLVGNAKLKLKVMLWTLHNLLMQSNWTILIKSNLIKLDRFKIYSLVKFSSI